MHRLILLGSLLLGLAVFVAAPDAHAQNLIKRPRAHTQYTTELEPHLSLGGYHGLLGGPGVRASWPVADPAFIPKLNNSVAIGVGAEFHFHDYCHRHGGVDHCHDTTLAIPVAMQWNFWFTKNWSAFGEPGVVLGLRPHNDLGLNIAVGGRYQFNDGIALTVRLGLPVASIGVSFFL